MDVIDPEMRLWRVCRRWGPWPQVFLPPATAPRRADESVSSAGHSVPADVAAATLVPFLWAFELLAWLLAFPFTLTFRLAARRPWPVLARCEGIAIWEAPAGDFAASGALAAQVGEAIRRGHYPPRTIPE